MYIHSFVIENGGGVFYETRIGKGKIVELSLTGAPLVYTINANTFATSLLNKLTYPPSNELLFLALGSDGQCYRLRILTDGRIYAPYAIPKGITLSGCIRYSIN